MVSDIEPLVPAEVDLTTFPFMPVHVQRLIKSDTWLAAAENKTIAWACINLWFESWHQRPASSLPSDDQRLARIAQCKNAEFRKIKDVVLQGWTLCSDGRYYHKFVAEVALEAYIGKLKDRYKAGIANFNQYKSEFNAVEIAESINFCQENLKKLNKNSKFLKNTSNYLADSQQYLLKFEHAKKAKSSNISSGILENNSEKNKKNNQDSEASKKIAQSDKPNKNNGLDEFLSTIDVKKPIHDGIRDGVNNGIHDGIRDGVQQGIHDGIHGGVHDGILDGIHGGVRNGTQQTETRTVIENLKTLCSEQSSKPQSAEDEDFQLSSPSQSDLGLPIETSPYQLVLLNGTDYNVPVSYVKKMYECYPAVDVDSEMRKMMAWCISNPRKRKTAGGILRFANDWLSKAQNAAGGGKVRGQNLTEGKWSGFTHKDYSKGINEDGTF